MSGYLVDAGRAMNGKSYNRTLQDEQQGNRKKNAKLETFLK